MAPKPLKRHKALQPLSRDHHHGLLLSWKIRTGLNKQISPKRIKVYCDWFFENHLMPHFELEETHIFPLLGMEHELIQRGLVEHRLLKELFEDQENISKSLSLIEEDLEQHIRFEERVLFPEIQKIATEDDLILIGKIHLEKKFMDNVEDEFWR